MFKTMALLITLTASTPKQPTLKYVGVNSYLAINPIQARVEMALDCGSDYERVRLEMLPRTQEALVIAPPPGVETAVYCVLADWKKLK